MRLRGRRTKVREFLPPDLLPDDIVAVFDQMSLADARAQTEPYRGCWLRVRGRLSDAVRLERNLAVARFAHGAGVLGDPSVRVEMYFRGQSIERLNGRNREDAVVIGQIMEILPAQIVLDFCELDDGP